MEAKSTVKFLEEKVNKGEIKKINERHSFNIGVTDGSKNYNCTVIMDVYTDLEDNHLYRVEQHIDQTRDYHTIDIIEFNNVFLDNNL